MQTIQKKTTCKLQYPHSNLASFPGVLDGTNFMRRKSPTLGMIFRISMAALATADPARRNRSSGISFVKNKYGSIGQSEFVLSVFSAAMRECTLLARRKVYYQLGIQKISQM
jgi:hypothetical protein